MGGSLTHPRNQGAVLAFVPFLMPQGSLKPLFYLPKREIVNGNQADS